MLDCTHLSLNSAITPCFKTVGAGAGAVGAILMVGSALLGTFGKRLAKSIQTEGTLPNEIVNKAADKMAAKFKEE